MDEHMTLAGIDEQSKHIAIAVIIGGCVALLKRFAPSWFAALPRGLQAAPAILLGAGLATILGDDHAIRDAALGALDGILAIGGHHTLKRAKVPPVPPAAGLVALLWAFGCAELRQANDARIALCDALGAEQVSAIEAYSERTGVSLAEAYALFRAQCKIRSQKIEADTLAGMSAPVGACE